MFYVLLSLITLLEHNQIQSTTGLITTEVINEKLYKWELDMMRGSRRRRKRAIVVFAPHITFPATPGKIPVLRAKYGDLCNGEFFQTYTKPVYDNAAKEDDDQFGVYANKSIEILLTELKTRTENIETNKPPDGMASWLQAGCIGWFPMNCTNEGGNGAPKCRCLNSPEKDTPKRHHPHYIQEGGKCRVEVGAFCRYHPQYKSGAKCARNGKCVNNQCVLITSGSQLLTIHSFFWYLAGCSIFVLNVSLF